ncbi:DUF6392 family protein [Rahnella perminowiae]|uniref:DUF6392 family protein n=1 Tax=Rahnella perminowiae TaxID=2816244 RepID=UPI00224B02D5|nr:DUF6392 family protein [Rahnella perminowiae]MCX2944850.1 DUF6392 family protein [Rahnella perminowiae]
MSINVEALIRSLGKTYQEICDAGLIHYKTKPSGSPGSSFVSLNMQKEGVYLAFKREGKYLLSITVTLVNRDDAYYVFQNELPDPLQNNMHIEWVHKFIGLPDGSIQPRRIGRHSFGLKEKYTLKGFQITTAMEIMYTSEGRVETLTFLHASELRW